MIRLLIFKNGRTTDFISLNVVKKYGSMNVKSSGGKIRPAPTRSLSFGGRSNTGNDCSDPPEPICRNVDLSAVLDPGMVCQFYNEFESKLVHGSRRQRLKYTGRTIDSIKRYPFSKTVDFTAYNNEVSVANENCFDIIYRK